MRKGQAATVKQCGRGAGALRRCAAGRRGEASSTHLQPRVTALEMAAGACDVLAPAGGPQCTMRRVGRSRPRRAAHSAPTDCERAEPLACGHRMTTGRRSAGSEMAVGGQPKGNQRATREQSGGSQKGPSDGTRVVSGAALACGGSTTWQSRLPVVSTMPATPCFETERKACGAALARTASTATRSSLPS